MRPGPFDRYQEYKPALQAEFERKCVYCRVPDFMRGWEGFGVDHYRPKSLFPALQNTYANLFYCCNQCNRRKGSYWPTRSNARIPNPCDYEMHKHMRFADELVDGRTPQGKAALELLDLNAPDALQMRVTINATLKLQQKALVQMRDKLAALQGIGTPDAAEPVAQLQATIADVQGQMDRFMGL